jgi:uncharacterized repeat protein (TIGR03843 family)
MIQAFPNDLLKNALREGDLEMKGQFTLGSNYTFLVSLHYDGKELSAVYKPSRGEQPLWDFPENSLALREVAAYWVSEGLGWHFVPLTILREDGPLGPGSLQQYIEYDPEYHYFNFSKKDKLKLKPVVVFDLLVNNADRKGSHVFFENDTHKIWLIDHGLCFHAEDKLRTVIWDFAGERIPEDLLQTLGRLSTEKALLGDLQNFLSPREISALKARAKALIASGVFPDPPPGRRSFPYPPV